MCAGVVPQQPPIMLAPAATSAGTRPAMSDILRQAGISVDQNRRLRRGRAHFADDLDHPLHAIAAVRADNVRAGVERGLGGSGRRDTHHRPVVARHRAIEREGANDFASRVRARGANRGGGLIERGHGLDADAIGPAGGERHNLLLECVLQIFLGHVAHQCHLTGRPDGGDDPAVRPGGRARDGGGGSIDLGDAVGESIMLELVACAAEGIGFDHVGAGGDITLCDVEHVGAVRHAPQFRTLAGLETLFLKASTPCAVGHQRPSGVNGIHNLSATHIQLLFKARPPLAGLEKRRA